ncbi:MAG: hypothetical protein HEP71_34680 [Roseivirga sp.]|nr:hypothetical protein [Roseivirga sp.]
MKHLNIRERLAEVLEQHDISFEQSEEGLWVKGLVTFEIMAYVTYRELNDNIASRLDVVIRVGEGEMVESFGDVATNLEEAIARNMENFLMNTFHVLIKAFYDESDEYVEAETWNINGTDWSVCIGNITHKNQSEESDLIPEGFFETVESVIKEATLDEDLHWFRSFYCQQNHQELSSEFMKDNELYDTGVQALSNLPWKSTGGFYTLRQFTLLKRLSQHKI